MKHSDLQDLLSAYADGELARTQREFVERHAADCSLCQAMLADYKRDRLQLASLRSTPIPSDLKQAAMSKIRAAQALNRLFPRSGVSGAGPPGPYRGKRFGCGDRNRDSTVVWRWDDREVRGGNCCASILPRNRVGNCHQVRRNLSIGNGNRIFGSRPISGHRRRAGRCSRVHRKRR